MAADVDSRFRDCGRTTVILRILRILCIMIAPVASGCGQVPMPKPVKNLPALLRPGERAKAFKYYTGTSWGSLEKVDVASGEPLVIIGAVAPFANEMLEWHEMIAARVKALGKPCEVMLFLERCDVTIRNRLLKLMGRPVPFLLDRDGLYPKAFGFVGEGPHVVVIAGDGTTRAVIDGPVHPSRTPVLLKALDKVLEVLEAPEAEAEGPGADKASPAEPSAGAEVRGKD